MTEFNEPLSSEPPPHRPHRLLWAFLLVALLGGAGVVGFIVLPSQDGKGPSNKKRAVRTSAPKQVSAPGREPREPLGELDSGDRLPSFALPDLSGRMTPSSELKGKTLVLNIWASWCPPCLKEMPALQELHEAAGEDFRVVSISVDEDVRDARALAEKYALTFPVLLDPSGDLPAKLGTVMYPETWILDGNGRVLERVIGEREWAHPEIIRRLRAGLPTGWAE